MTPTIEDVLKKQYEEMVKKYPDKNWDSWESVDNDMTKEFIYGAMTEYASLNRQGWTKIDEGEKEAFKQILLTDGNNYSIGFFGSDGLTDWEVNKYFNSIPSHWMPLPNKPSI